MNIQKLKLYINRPEYIFRPNQIFQRFFKSNFHQKNEFHSVNLPWGLNIKIPTNPNDVVGKAICTYGIYDLSLTELLWRLISPGETALDIGANIGYMTSIMAKRVGQTGKVISFEPNLEVYGELCENINNWQKNLGVNYIINNNIIYPQQIALSNHAGSGVLHVPSKNRGEAFIDVDHNTSDKSNSRLNYFTVSLERLDKVLETEQKNIGVLKIDVEGHELQVLQGAGELISLRKIRDIIFEEHRSYPSDVTQFLEANGYNIFRIWKGFWKPLLLPPTENLVHNWEPPNYLATHNPTRATQLMKEWGWKCLQGK